MTRIRRLDITEWQELLRRVQSDISQAGFVYPKPLARLLEHSFKDSAPTDWAHDAVGKWYRMVDSRITAAQARAVAKALTQEERGWLLRELAFLLVCLKEQRAANLEWMVPPTLLAPSVTGNAVADVIGAIAAATEDLLIATSRLAFRLDDEKAWGLIDMLRRACLLWAAVPHAIQGASFPYVRLAQVVAGHAFTNRQYGFAAHQDLSRAIELIPPAEPAEMKIKEQLQALIGDALRAHG